MPEATPSFGFYAYPWNLDAVGQDAAGMQAMGMGHIAVAASYHAGKFIQPRARGQRVYFPEDGTVYFRARAERYGRLKPQVAAATEDRDTLRALGEADGLRCRAWTVLNHNSRLGWAHLDVVARNAWGDPYPYSLCPAHPDVAAYATALCADLADQYDLECLLLETPGWLTYDHGYHHEFAQVTPDAEAVALLGLCFCESCRAGATKAGIDFGALQAAVRRRIDAGLDGGPAAPVEAADELAAFHRWRASVVTALAADIRGAVRDDVGLRAISTCQRPHSNAYLEGHDLAALAAALGGLELPIYQPTCEAAAADMAWVDRTIGAAPRGVILRPGHPDLTSEDQLRATVAAMIAAKADSISFYNYGLLPAAAIERVARVVGEMGDGA